MSLRCRFIALLFILGTSHTFAAQEGYVSTTFSKSSFPLFSSGESAPLVVDDQEYPGVIRAVRDLQTDIERVTGAKPNVSTQTPSGKEIVIIGTIEKSAFISKLIKSKKLNVSEIKGKWEASLTQIVEKPFPGIERALVIAGSDKRGTIFGTYELSKQIGVSPWHWWADVPPQKVDALFINAGQHIQAPVIKYRGIFINDEQPALGGWVNENYGGFNNKFYTKVFELILRLRGNFLWPAMWGQSFYTEDALNPKLADEYGVVISTSHHEPMMRAHVEWQRHKGGSWNYASNDSTLREFWRDGIKRMGTYESIVTLAMRGDGDEPMSEESNISLLQRIVSDQRKIIREVTRKSETSVPQVWALYKEVQDYYDRGMRVPDDVTLLLCDDNWGNIRKLPQLNEPKRSGGYGIYYHFDYVGGPRNYKWLNTNPIARVWEQMHLAYQYGADRLWIVNVGDIKPMEFPISFFLDYAWDPKPIRADQLGMYTEQWCAQQFGAKDAKAIASLLSQYTKFNGRIKPELLNEDTYSLIHYNEFENVVNEYAELETRALAISYQLEPTQQEAYYQLILHPIVACANLHKMYYCVALNKDAISRNDERANYFADKAKEHYRKDSLITVEYHARNKGKWNHMMSQTHIGYTYWQQPPVNKMPPVRYISGSISLSEKNETTSRNAVHLIPNSKTGNIFFEKDGYVSIEAHNVTTAHHTNGITWTTLPDHGKTGSAITAFPVTASKQNLSTTSPHIEYEFYCYSEVAPAVQLYFSPTLNFHKLETGLQYAVSIDTEEPQIVNLNADDTQTGSWEKWVAHNIIIKQSTHQKLSPGKHTLKLWMIHPGVVLQKIVLDFGGVLPSYLGPPETKYKSDK